MHDAGGVDRVHPPKAGDLLLFAGPSNLHSVERVTRGNRFALTALFELQESACGALFDDDRADPGDPYASWDALLASAAEVSLTVQDPRRADAADGASALGADWCDARVDYAPDAEPFEGAGADAGLVALVDAVLRAAAAPEGGAWDAFGDDSDGD